MAEPPLRLALIRQRYTPYGGAERFIERALCALTQQELDITLIAREWQATNLAINANSWRYLKCNPSAPTWRGRAARDRSFAVAVQALLAREKYDLTQTHEKIPGCDIYRAGDGVHAAWLEQLARSDGFFGKLYHSISPYHRYQIEAENKLYNHPQLKAVICNSQMVKLEIVSQYALNPGKIHVIYNGVDNDMFSPDLSRQFRASERARLRIDEQATVLLFVGNGFKRKGLPQLLSAFANMRRDAVLVVVGADRNSRTMLKLARQLNIAARVLFLGALTDVRPCYGMADAFVLPSRYDPCPNAVLEAMSSALPVLTSNSCGAKEWINHGVNGYVVDALDCMAIREQLDKLCVLAMQPEAHAAARAAVQNLTLECMAMQMAALYQRLFDDIQEANM